MTTEHSTRVETTVADTVVVIPAAGRGRRMGLTRVPGAEDGNKVLLPLAGEPIIQRTVACFQYHPRILSIAIVAGREDFPSLDGIFGAEGGRGVGGGQAKLLPWIEGGRERQDSVRFGLEALSQAAGGPPRWVLIHDGARPFCPRRLIDRLLEALENGARGVVPLVPVNDSLRRIEAGDGGRSETVSREGLYRVQTPQGFDWETLWQSHREAALQGHRGTDDAQLLESAGFPVTWVTGAPENLKITTPADLEMAERLVGNSPPEFWDQAGSEEG